MQRTQDSLYHAKTSRLLVSCKNSKTPKLLIAILQRLQDPLYHATIRRLFVSCKKTRRLLVSCKDYSIPCIMQKLQDSKTLFILQRLQDSLYHATILRPLVSCKKKRLEDCLYHAKTPSLLV